MKRQFKLITVLSTVLCLSVLLTGCWDLIEIEQYFFISTMGIDVYKGEAHVVDEAEKESEENRLTEKDRFIITYVSPDLRTIGKNATSENPRIIMASVSNNPYETTKELATRTNRNFTFRHTKVVLLGEEVARNREYMIEIFDNLGRHEQLSRKLNVLVAKGTAKEIINIEAPYEPVTGYLINQIMSKKQSSSRYNDMVLEEILTELYFSGNVLIPRAIAGGGEVKVAGSGIIKNYELIGWLGEIENISAMFLMDRVNTAVLNIEHENAILPYVITNSRTKPRVTVEDGKIRYTVNIDTDGYIQQYKLGAEEKLTEQKTISHIEQKLEDVLAKQIRSTFEKLQKEFKVDVLGVGRYISKHNPKLWEEVKDNWEEVFTNIEFEINVDAKLRRIGMTK